MFTGKVTQARYKNEQKHIFLLFPGKGHSLPGVCSTYRCFKPFPESFQRIHPSLTGNRSLGFFFSILGAFFPGYFAIPINRGIKSSIAQRNKTSRESTGEGFGETHYGVTTVPSCLKTVRLKRIKHAGFGGLILTTPIMLGCV